MELKNLQKDILLTDYTTFRIGGPAKYFFEAKTEENLVDAIKWAKENQLPYFVLGGGSNLLVSDKGFDGLVIKVKSEKSKVKMENGKLKIEAEAGVPLIKIILETTKMGFSGAEWGFGIPGTIGGAICGNAHRLGQGFDQVVKSVEILDENFERKILKKEECEFSYGSSRFKKTNEIILSAELVFEKKDQKIINEVLAQAKAVICAGAPYPTAGCVFGNYEIKGDADSLLKNHPGLNERVRGGKIGVGYLIDQCGLKGKQIGGAKIWEGHANYIVNAGGAKAVDVIALINLCKKGVKEKYNIKLEEEIKFLGF